MPRARTRGSPGQRQVPSHDQAVEWPVTLRELAQRSGAMDDVKRRLQDVRQRPVGKTRFHRKMAKGLPTLHSFVSSMNLPNPLEGQACGDRIGGPIRMALLLGKSLVACNGYDEADLTARYLAWFRSEAFDSGPVWGEVFGLVAQGIPAREAARRIDERTGGMTAGVNAAHRATAIGCALAVIADDVVADIARREASLTHRHPDAGEAAAATALLVRALLRRATFIDAVELASSSVTGPTHERLLGALSVNPSTLSVGGYGPRVVEAAVHFAATSDSFADAIHRSIAFAGPSNYCPVLVGAFAAAYHGVTTVPACTIDDALREAIQHVFTALTQAT